MACNGTRKIDKLVEMLETTPSESIFDGCINIGYNSEECNQLFNTVVYGSWEYGVISIAEQRKLEEAGFKHDEVVVLTKQALYARAKFYSNRFLDGRHIEDVYKLVDIGRTGGVFKYCILQTIRAGLSVYKGAEWPVIGAIAELGDKESIESLRGIALAQYPPGDDRRNTVRVAVETLSELGDTELPAILLEVGGWVFVENPRGLHRISASIEFNDGDKLAENIKRMLLSKNEELETFALNLLRKNEQLFDDDRRLDLLEIACTIQNRYIAQEAVMETYNLPNSQRLKKFLLTQAISKDLSVSVWALREIVERNYADLVPTILADWFERRPESLLGEFKHRMQILRFWDILLPHLEHQLKTNPNENARLLALDIAMDERRTKKFDVDRLITIASRDPSPRVRKAASFL